jgi:hypothetical protein
MTDPTQGPVPPYVSFRTLLTQVERMHVEGVPSKIDKYFLVGMAGGTQNHFRHALRSLGFIEDDDRSTQLLHDLAGATPEERKQRFGAILRDRFPALVNLDTNASKSDFLSVLADYGMNSPDTQRKALTFFVGAAEYAGIPVSNHVKSGRAPSSPRKSAPRKSTKTGAGRTSESNGQAPKLAVDAVLTDGEMRGLYFKLLLKKAEEDDSMLDRIERLVGVSPDKDKSRGRKTAGSKPATPTGPDSQAGE